MSTENEIKRAVLSRAAEFAHAYASVAMGESVFACNNDSVRKEYWQLVKDVVLQSGDSVQVDIGKGDANQQMQRVLALTAAGDLTINQGQRLITMVQAGFEINELSELTEQLRKANEEG